MLPIIENNSIDIIEYVCFSIARATNQTANYSNYWEYAALKLSQYMFACSPHWLLARIHRNNFIHIEHLLYET